MHFATLNVNFHAQELPQGRPYLKPAYPPLVFELALVTASVDRAVRLLDQHEVTGFGRSPGGWSRNLRVDHPSRLDHTPVPFFERLPSYLFECRRCSTKASSLTLCSGSFIRGTSMSTLVGGLRPTKSSKMDMLPAIDGSGEVRFTQQAGDA